MRKLLLLTLLASAFAGCGEYDTRSYEDGPKSTSEQDIGDWLCEYQPVPDSIDYSDC